MDKKVQGSWLIHHTNKLQSITNQGSYQNTFIAGKAGILLSAISGTNENEITHEKLKILADASNINTAFELPKLLNILKDQELVDIGDAGIGVLGVTTSSALQHTSSIFESLEPSDIEFSAVELAETASIKPIDDAELSEQLSDNYRLSDSEMTQLLYDSEKIGFIDVENFGQNKKILFNGNLFRRDSAAKTKMVLDSLSSVEQSSLCELTDLLKQKACVSYIEAIKIIGEELFNKVNSIGLFDMSVVSNNHEEIGYLTLPSAFSKYSNSMVDDAFDLAKAFVASLTYGMTKSSYQRGQITMIDSLLTSLINGGEVGPVSAIGQDYKVLELKGVVSIRNGIKNGRKGPLMRLLKKEVGELALQAIRQGDVSEQSIQSLPGAIISKFSGPELNREILRRKQREKSPFETNDMIDALRTGGGF